MFAREGVDALGKIADLEVRVGDATVGRMAQPDPRGPVYFEYDRAWLATGYSISPLSLPLRPGVYEPSAHGGRRIHGVFADSLPDDWGKILVDRMLSQVGVDPSRIGPLARLALVGDSGRGALEYRPVVSMAAEEDEAGFDALYAQAKALLEDDGQAGSYDSLYRRGGSSGGARPKVAAQMDGVSWLVKFPLSAEYPGECADEYRYVLMAKRCGIDMPEVQLIPSQLCEGFFAIRRFDREPLPGGGEGKLHMASACALLEADPFEDALDYRDLMRLTVRLTSDARDAERLFRVMCFNVFAGNCDDHIKNFSYLCDSKGLWRLSPAYDLTRNPGFFGEHTLLVNGKGSGIDDADLVSVGEAGSLTARRARAICGEVKRVVLDELGTLDDAYTSA